MNYLVFSAIITLYSPHMNFLVLLAIITVII